MKLRPDFDYKGDAGGSVAIPIDTSVWTDMFRDTRGDTATLSGRRRRHYSPSRFVRSFESPWPAAQRSSSTDASSSTTGTARPTSRKSIALT